MSPASRIVISLRLTAHLHRWMHAKASFSLRSCLSIFAIETRVVRCAFLVMLLIVMPLAA